MSIFIGDSKPWSWKKRIFALSGAAVMGLLILGSVQQPAPALPPPAFENLPSERLKQSVAALFRDPSSVIFSNDLHFVQAQDGIHWKFLCGTANARNGFGGMTGAGPFVAVLADDNTATFLYSAAGLPMFSNDEMIVKRYCEPQPAPAAAPQTNFLSARK